MEVKKLTVLGGRDKDGNPEPVRELELKRGTVTAVVGPTGSGKSALLRDIEVLARGDTVTGRKVLVNGELPPEDLRFNPRRRLVAHVTQTMGFLADCTVAEFLEAHVEAEGTDVDPYDVLEVANRLTGEPIHPDMHMTELSGGQSRALMVADVAVIGDRPVVLLDEIENAGIKKHEALDELTSHDKIVVVVTHDPVIALRADVRVVMRNGAMTEIIRTSRSEREAAKLLEKVDDWLLELRERVREGERIEGVEPPEVTTA
ncbi:MAG: ATP-binding cassette domain-containing protein [Methanopyri archaeon]|nr:ATP-binding cassette domain-containing protein [Methanopyri archaeon]